MVPCIILKLFLLILCLKTSSAKIGMRITSIRDNRTPPTTPPVMAATGTAATAGLSLLVLLLVVISILGTSVESEEEL